MAMVRALMCSKLFADVREYKAVIVPSVGSPEAGRTSKLQMQNGKGVMKSVLKNTPLMIDALLDETSHAIDDIDMYITHQPNLNLLMAIANKMKIGHKKIYSSFPQCGNTVAASIPITFCKALESKAIKPKDTLMLLAMGAGFVGGGVIVN
jgi:3-oxoacyl-[acyl-carrier-protein] synthase III